MVHRTPVVARPWLLLLTACLLLAGCGHGVNALTIKPPASRWHASRITVPHIFIVMMENKATSQIVGNTADAPYINSLVRRYGFAANYYGVTHPSLPNYVSTIAGGFLGSQSDSPSQRFSGPTLVNQLEAHHLTWKAYAENLPYPGYGGSSFDGLYVLRHDPFLLMRDVLAHPKWRQNVVPASRLTSDLASGGVPNLAYIIPNLCHDMHGVVSLGSPCWHDLVQTGDTYLSALVPRILRSPTWTADSALFIVWDEGTSSNGCCDGPVGNGGGQAPAIVIARQGVRGYKSNATYNHYSLLKTVEAVWSLGCLRHTCDKKNVNAMTEFLRPPVHLRPTLHGST
jgi:phosphatidylinositol-3-phosphatase